MSNRDEGAVVIPEHTMKEMLRKKGISVPAGSLCRSMGEAERAAKGFPLVCKIVSDKILHKTEYNGVQVNIQNREELRSVFNKMDRAAMENGLPGYQGILVEEMADPGVEIILGIQHDPVFGPVLMAGLGGIFTDIFQDVAFGLLPLSGNDARVMLRSLKGLPLLEGFRGSEPVDIGLLVDTMVKIGDLGMEMAGQYESMDFNPVIAGPKSCTVVDAKMSKLESDISVLEETEPRNRNIRGFFEPKSVAVVGASNTKDKIGNVILDSLLNLDFRGNTYPINPSHDTIMGIQAYKGLSGLPEVPELVIFVVALEAIPPLLEEMGDIGSKNALIVSGGGKELGGGYADVEKTIADCAAEKGIRIIGPNCIGSFDGHSRFDTFFYHRHRFKRPGPGSMSFITQSGTWGCSFMEAARISGVSKMMSYGNRVDVDEGDLISFLADDENTSVIGSYLEGLGKGRRFLKGAEYALEKNKPVVVFKTGRTRAAASASVSHTGAYGGSYNVYEGVMKQKGIVVTDSFHECLAACEALALQPEAQGNRVALLSNGAGPMVNALDHFDKKGLVLAALDDSSKEKMEKAFSYFYIVDNPVDVTGSASAADYELVIKTLLDDSNVDIIMPFFVFQNTPLDESIVEKMDVLNKLRKKPILCCASEGEYSSRMSASLKELGIPVYHEVINWAAAASAAAEWHLIRKERGIRQ